MFSDPCHSKQVAQGQSQTASDTGLNQSPFQEAQNQYTPWPASDKNGAESNKFHEQNIQREIWADT